MYDIDQIHKKIFRFYEKGDILKAFVLGQDIFPIIVPLRKIKESDIQKNYSYILQSIRKLEKTNFPLALKEFSFKALGVQKLPIRVEFGDINIYLETIGKKEEFERFKTIFRKITQVYPCLSSLFAIKPFLILEYEDIWDRLLAVVGFILDNPKPDVYIRELCIDGVDTKFIEKNAKIIDILISNINNTQPLNSLANYAFEQRYCLLFPEPQIRFRILDKRLYINGLSDISLPKSQFERLEIDCKKVFIVENMITTLSFPAQNDSIVIFGKGYGVSALKEVSWLANKQIFYWGDIDLDGYAILSSLRSSYPQAKSFLMDMPTFNQFYTKRVSYPKREKVRILPNLNEEEYEVYNLLCAMGEASEFRIEQERIPFGYLLEYLKREDFSHSLV